MNTHFDPELARLDFEDRLVALCEDPVMPLLERVRLLGIAAGRLDVYRVRRRRGIVEVSAEPIGLEEPEPDENTLDGLGYTRA